MTRQLTMSIGRLPSLAMVMRMALALIALFHISLAITTIHHDKPESAQPERMASQMRLEEGFVPMSLTILNATKLESSERQKRLLPYMTFYLEQDFNRPHGQPLPPPTSYATAGAIKPPTILQQYHNKFTEHTNGQSFPAPHTSNKYIQVTSQKVKLTPFSDSNALPGPFLPMRYPPLNIQAQPQPQPQPIKSISYASNAKPNYSAIYDKLSQLKLQQQLQLAQNYNRYFPQNYGRKPPPPSTQQLQHVQQVYIPINEYANSPIAYKPGAKTIVQTYTASNIDIPPPPPPASSLHSNNQEIRNNINNAPEEYALPVKTYNEPVMNYRTHHQQEEQYIQDSLPPSPAPPQLKKHVLKPVILVRPKENVDANNDKPYLIIQRKPQSQQQQAYNIELQFPETINYRPSGAKYANEQLGKFIVESVTPKYVDIIPKYEIQPNIMPIHPTFGEPYNTKIGPIGASINVQPLHPIAPPPPPPTPHPKIITYHQPHSYDKESAEQDYKESPEQNQDYVDSDEIKYEKPKYSHVQLHYANTHADNEQPTITPTTTKHPTAQLPYIERPKYSADKGVEKSVKFIQTYASQSPTTVTYPPNESTQAASTLPEYQEGSNSLSLILKKLQDTNALPQTLTPDNIDNSIRTLVKILSSLKKQPKFQKPIVVQDDSLDYEGNNEAGVNLGEIPGTVTQIFPDHTPEGGTPGTPGVDYPALSSIPQTSFNCKTQRYKGFFGDPDTNCQVWHYCDLNGGQASFLCPNGTIFSQVALTCDWWYNVKCSNTAQLYVLNERLYKYILPLAPKFPEDYSGPLVDRYLALKFQEMEERMKKERKQKEDEEIAALKDARPTESTLPNAIQDDADELREETIKQQNRDEHKNYHTSAPIVVPDEIESNETAASTSSSSSSSSMSTDT